MMRKRIITPDQQETASPEDDWLNLDEFAEVEIKSEDAAYPIEGALLPGGSGWRAGGSGKQIIRLLFADPQPIRRIWLEFVEPRMARTQEYVFAAYMDAWQRKVERIGNLNYPDEAKRHRLAGSLILQVDLNPDGTVRDVQLLRSSGEKILDDAAIRIVRLSAPYAPFTPAMREETDILQIIRTWQVLAGNRLTAG